MDQPSREWLDRNFSDQIVNIGVADLEDIVAKLRIGFVRTMARNYLVNMQAVDELLGLPFSLPLHREMQQTIETACQFDWKTTLGSESVTDKLVRFFTPFAEYREPNLRRKIREKLEQVLETNPLITHALDQLFRSTVSNSWAALETLASDLWIAALNEEPIRLAMAANSKGQSKTIEVEQLKDFHFDLSKSMGTLLQSKFKFTGVENIEHAYKSAFSQPVKWNELREQLAFVEQCRHLIQHKMGIVDQQFSKKQKAL